MRKLRKDKHGISAVVIAIVVAAIVISVSMIAFLAFAKTGINLWDPPDEDANNDGKPDPIIGYIYLSAKSKVDNGEWFGGTIFNIESLKGEFIPGTPSAQILDMNGLDIWGHDFSLKMKYTVTGPGDFYFTATKEYKQDVPGGGVTYKDVTPDTMPKVRYHGTYTFNVNMYNGDDIVDTMTTTIEV